METIRVHEPVATDAATQRLNLFSGRHMGEQEFDLLQSYFDARLAPMLGGYRPGIVSGLNVELKTIGGAGEGFVVQPGFAIGGNGKVLGLYYPLRISWNQLFEDFLSQPDVTDIAGVYYLVLKRTVMPIDDLEEMDACNRFELDPTRDRKLEMVGSIGLQRLSLGSDALNSSPYTVANNVCAGKLDPGVSPFSPDNSDVPLALLAIKEVAATTVADTATLARIKQILSQKPSTISASLKTLPIKVKEIITIKSVELVPKLQWFNEAAGRYMAVENSEQQTLLNQVLSSFSETIAQLQETGLEGDELMDALSQSLELNYLPSAGRLPTELLMNPEGDNPSLRWFKNDLAIDMIPVAASQVEETLQRALPHGAINLMPGSRDRLRLLLAVDEQDYKPDLLDLPEMDTRLDDDITFYATRSYNSYYQWEESYDKLFHLSSETRTGYPGIEDVLKIPDKLPEPLLPSDFVEQILQQKREERKDETGALPDIKELPLPYREMTGNLADKYDAGVRDNDPPAPTEDGLIAKYAVCQKRIDILEEEINELEERLQKTRDFLLLQRQQLDSQTISFARLAGGVAGDGSGLKLTRWLPYTKLKLKQ